MLTIKSRYKGLASNEIIKDSYTIGTILRKQFQEILDKNHDIVTYRETKGLIESHFHVTAPAWFHKGLERWGVESNSHEAIIKTRKKNTNTIKEIVEHYALDIYYNYKKQLIVKFPNEEYIKKFKNETKQQKIKVKIKTL